MTAIALASRDAEPMQRIDRIALPGAREDRLYFAQVREDPTFEVAALSPRAGDHVVGVSSGFQPTWLINGQTFDPAEAEAVSIVPPPDPAKDHTVAATFQTGYRFKGTLVRPARVQVYSEGQA